MTIYRTIQFTPEESEYCSDQGEQRARAVLGYTNRRNWTGMTAEEKETVGVWGEYGLHLMFGCPYFDILRPDGAVEGRYADTIMEGLWIDAKTMKDKYSEMFLKMWYKPLDEITCDVFALLYSDGHRVDFYGFIHRDNFLIDANLHQNHPLMRNPGWLVSERELVATLGELR